MKDPLIVQDYNGWKIVIGRNFLNAYTTTPPVKQLTADSIDEIKTLIDKEEL